MFQSTTPTVAAHCSWSATKRALHRLLVTSAESLAPLEIPRRSDWTQVARLSVACYVMRVRNASCSCGQLSAITSVHME
jgi:hypothetical protein